MKDHIGISCGFHDASISIINSLGDIVYAGHSERYSKIKFDSNLNEHIINDSLNYITSDYDLHYYEKPYIKTLRQIRAGQQLTSIFATNIIGKNNHKLLNNKKVNTYKHHLCHSAAGFQTSPFNDATIVIIDAIGELDTISIWNAYYDKNGIAQYKKLYSKTYPDSIGLFYSAMTKRIGLKPLDEEYILMGMSAYGTPALYKQLKKEIIVDIENIEFTNNLHYGVLDTLLENENILDIACATQLLLEELIDVVMQKAKLLGSSNNLVYGGGVALNCLVNRHLGNYFNNIWIMPNPGDAGNSLGAAALGYKKKINWNNCFLGYNINKPYKLEQILNELQNNKIVGVANGRAEFGPRSLGNRSLLADPRELNIKDKVNDIKRREKFRPFAPVILEEKVHEYFTMPINWNTSRYMQVVGDCKYPKQFPGIIHIDNTSRIQTVPNDGSNIRILLEEWYKKTNCPMLLNTSLNIKGQPIVNDEQDAAKFEKLYNVKVL